MEFELEDLKDDMQLSLAQWDSLYQKIKNTHQMHIGAPYNHIRTIIIAPVILVPEGINNGELVASAQKCGKTISFTVLELK